MADKSRRSSANDRPPATSLPEIALIVGWVIFGLSFFVPNWGNAHGSNHIGLFYFFGAPALAVMLLFGFKVVLAVWIALAWMTNATALSWFSFRTRTRGIAIALCWSLLIMLIGDTWHVGVLYPLPVAPYYFWAVGLTLINGMLILREKGA